MARHPTRADLVDLVQFILEGTPGLSEVEGTRLVERFEAAVPHPAASDLIFYPAGHFASDPTAAEIVDAALGYRPIDDVTVTQ
ncbi:bacteriocin immunity protein [Promicromonospora sp. NPDC019610]|uniref:bacteriocin immunity protein n=1 Tax=Promicromonospora sp. NPDC019610 TaxID=3364405 RepID=UPI00379D2AC4